jgi:hypothetical protein
MVKRQNVWLALGKDLSHAIISQFDFLKSIKIPFMILREDESEIW